MGQKICPLLQVTFPCQICPSGIRLVTETMECLSQSWTLVQNTLGLDGHGELLRRRPLCTGSRPDRRPGHQLEVHLWGETHHASSHQTDCRPNHHMSMETSLASKPHANLVDLDRRTPKVPMHFHHRAKVPLSVPPNP